jgi:hypothetical protein
MTEPLNEPHKNFIGALVFLLNFFLPLHSPLSHSGQVSAHLAPLTFERLCAGARFSADIVIRNMCYSFEI